MIQNREEKRRGAPAVSVLFDIHPENEDNYRIGQMIDEFQKVYDADMAECEGFRRKQRRLGAWADRTLGAGNEMSEAAKSTILDEPAEFENEFQEKLGNLRRKAQEYRRWDPFHETIVRSLWFYGYEGSLTEPPCSEFGKSPFRTVLKIRCLESFANRSALRGFLFTQMTLISNDASSLPPNSLSINKQLSGELFWNQLSFLPASWPK